MTLNYTELIQGRYEIETLSPRSIDSQSLRDYAFNVLITAASKIILSSWKPSVWDDRYQSRLGFWRP